MIAPPRTTVRLAVVGGNATNRWAASCLAVRSASLETSSRSVAVRRVGIVGGLPVDSRWTFPARVRRVVDGDTLDVTLDLGFGLWFNTRLRLLGVDTHETYGVNSRSREARLGRKEAAWVKEWLAEAHGFSPDTFPLFVETRKQGKYGRYLATITRATDGAVLQDDLVEKFPEVDRA